MKTYLLLLCLCVSTAFANNADTLSILIPEQVGTMGKNFGKHPQECETRYMRTAPCTDGLITIAAYCDGMINTVMYAGNDKNIGNQHVFWNGAEISRSREFLQDPDQPGVVIHVHKKFLVYTSKEWQKIVPRQK